MQVKHREWLQLYATVFMQRFKARDEVTRQMLARSQEQIKKSKELLNTEVPRTGLDRPKRKE